MIVWASFEWTTCPYVSLCVRVGVRGVDGRYCASSARRAPFWFCFHLPSCARECWRRPRGVLLTSQKYVRALLSAHGCAGPFFPSALLAARELTRTREPGSGGNHVWLQKEFLKRIICVGASQPTRLPRAPSTQASATERRARRAATMAGTSRGWQSSCPDRFGAATLGHTGRWRRNTLCNRLQRMRTCTPFYALTPRTHRHRRKPERDYASHVYCKRLRTRPLMASETA